MLKEMLENVREKKPLIHNITNYVTVNDCANILLAAGGSPIMSDDINEVEEITSICAGLNINIGTLGDTIPSMFKAGIKARELCHPVVLDPVGAGASSLRTQTSLNIIDKVHPTVIRGNISEIKTLTKGSGTTKGVDADETDKVTEDNLKKVAEFIKEYAKSTGAVIAITGAIDIVADKERVYAVYNGHPMMSSVTGTGCQLSALTTAYISANPNDVTKAVLAAVCTMGLCGEIAAERMAEKDGNVSYRNYIIDAMYNLDGDTLEKGAKYKLLEV